MGLYGRGGVVVRGCRWDQLIDSVVSLMTFAIVGDCCWWFQQLYQE